MSDTRFCYGATCTWFGAITEVGAVGAPPKLPCCPLCGGMLFELLSEAHWWKDVDRYERERPYPHYRKMWEWQRAAKVCFPLRGTSGISGLEAAFKEAMEKKDAHRP